MITLKQNIVNNRKFINLFLLQPNIIHQYTLTNTENHKDFLKNEYQMNILLQKKTSDKTPEALFLLW